MASNTPNLGLLKKDPATDGNDTFNVKTMLNENWDKIDEAVGNIKVNVPDASTTQKGIVQLSNATNSELESTAATSKAIKNITDEMNKRLPMSGGNITNNLTIQSNQVIHSGNILSYIPTVDTGDQVGRMFYVDGSAGIDTPGRGSENTPCRTISFCLSQIKKHLIGNVTIAIRAGIYSESMIDISGFDGPYKLEFRPWYPNTNLSVDITGYIKILGCTVWNISFYGLKFAQCIDSRDYSSSRVNITSCQFYSTFQYGIIFTGQGLDVSFTNFVNKPVCISMMSGFLVFSSNNTGSNNTTGISAENGAIVTIRGTIDIGAITTFKATGGAQIFNTPYGVIRTS
ncbi:hypothetical protein J23TS9_47750 [Paenibacillus sp. J23TS9]|uniref:phage tail protein n=1 Tax=Paenibacillus sp. J23TS9 TaxID=2807193 RepID=UPI001B26ACD0|nr:phage tail protein [Paenibacillus sp. J23TS9]GIP29645.1 hypothetical protein J23TS9_47750 [Paenibacillus sp. J23TS9]